MSRRGGRTGRSPTPETLEYERPRSGRTGQWPVARRQPKLAADPMSPPVDPVRSDPSLPDRAGVVVIGGGIIGTCTALFLAEKGHSVVLCEKGRIGGEQSSRNWGWCRTMGRDAREIPLAIESLRLWRGMNARINRETGFRQAGIAYLCETEKEVAAQEAWLAEARQYQVDARLLRGADDRRAGAGCVEHVRRRDAHADRWTRRTVAGRAGHRRGGACGGCHDADRMRGARHRDAGRTRLRRGHREGAHRLRRRGARRRRLVAAVLRQRRDRPAAAARAGLGVPHRAAERRAGDHRRRLGVRVPQAAGRRLHDRPAQRQRRRHHARFVPAAAALPADAEAELRRDPPALRPALLRGMAHPAPLVAGRGDAVRGGARARSGAEAGHAGRGARRCCHAVSRRSRGCRWRRAGAG